MRRGITPVVAVVLLLMMTVVAAGGAYTFITTTTQQAQSEADARISTNVEVRDASCGRGSVELSLVNVGDRAIDTAEAELLVFDGAGDRVAARTDVDISDLSLAPGSFISPTFLVPATLLSGTRYRVELTFPAEGYSVETFCRPRTGANDPLGVWTFDDEPSHRPVVLYDDVPQLYHIRNFENGSFGSLQSFGSAYSKENDGGVAMADFTRSGEYDILFYGESHSIYLWSDIGRSTPSGSPQQVASLDGSKAQGFAPGDWDEDGDIDVIENRDGDYIENFGNGSWRTYSLPFSGHRDIVGADFDRDGCEDIVYDTGSGSDVDFRPGRCNGTFGSGSTVFSTTDADNWLAAADFDGDGNQDVVVVPEAGDGDADLYSGNGDGTFTLANGNFTSFNDGNHRNPVASDFDGDGDQDLILAEHNGDNVWYAEGNGDGTFQAEVKLGDTVNSVLGAAAPGNDFVLDHAGTTDGKRIGPPNRTAGREGGGLRFDGLDDAIQIRDVVQGRNALTVSAWVRLEDTSQDRVITGDWGQSSGSHVFWYDSGNDVFAATYSGASTLYGETSPAVGEWYHVAWTMDAASGELRLLVDGEVEGVTSISSSIGGTTNNTRFGGDYGSHGNMAGYIDEVQIYPTALR